MTLEAIVADIGFFLSREAEFYNVRARTGMRRAHACYECLEGERFAPSAGRTAAATGLERRTPHRCPTLNAGGLGARCALARPACLAKGGNAMKVKDAMCNDVQLIGPNQTIREAVPRMIEYHG